MLELAGSWMEAGGNVRCQLRIAPQKNGLTETSFFGLEDGFQSARVSNVLRFVGSRYPGALFARSIRSVLMDCQMNQYESDQAW